MKWVQACLLILFVTPAAQADLSISLVDSGSKSSTILTAGSFFDVSVRLDLDPGPALWSGQFFLQDVTSAGVFTLTGIDLGTAAGWDSLDFNPSPAALDAGSNFMVGDIGASSSAGAGSGVMLTLHLQLASFAGPGVYMLGLFDDPADLLDPLFYDNVNFNQVALAGLPSYSVTIPATAVAPAPGATLLAVVGLGMIGWKRNQLARM